MSINLIQLVSEQTLPNVFAALALKPQRMTLCYTPGFRQYTRWIETALKQAELSCEFSSQPLGEVPMIHETGSAIRKAIESSEQDGLTPVVNFTGGTKPMSIGAFAAAMNKKVPSIYLDSAYMRFHTGETAPLPPQLRDNYAAWREVRQQLNLDIIGAAHGIDAISQGEDPVPYLPLARFLWHNPAVEKDVHHIMYKINPRYPNEVLQLLDKTLSGIPEDLLQLGAQANIFERRGQHWHFIRPDSLAQLEAWNAGTRYSPDQWAKALAPLQQNLNLLNGGWWELAVFDCMQRSERFTDLRWSAEVHFGEQTFEKDILAIEQLNLAIVSCKRGGQRSRLVGALDELDASARQIGGSHANRYLCVALAVSSNHFHSVQERARQTRTHLIGPAVKLRPESFSETHQ